MSSMSDGIAAPVIQVLGKRHRPIRRENCPRAIRASRQSAWTATASAGGTKAENQQGCEPEGGKYRLGFIAASLLGLRRRLKCRRSGQEDSGSIHQRMRQELAGLLSFATATIACLIAAWHSGTRDKSTWKVLALINCLFLMEIYFGLRFSITELVRTLLKTEDLYGELHGSIPGIIVISILALVFLSLFLLWRRVRGGAARVAASITIAILFLFAIETVSLHSINRILLSTDWPSADAWMGVGDRSGGDMLGSDSKLAYESLPETKDKRRIQRNVRRTNQPLS